MLCAKFGVGFALVVAVVALTMGICVCAVAVLTVETALSTYIHSHFKGEGDDESYRSNHQKPWVDAVSVKATFVFVHAC